MQTATSRFCSLKTQRQQRFSVKIAVAPVSASAASAVSIPTSVPPHIAMPTSAVASAGQIVEGTSSLDEAPVAGESMPRAKTKGDSVFVGSINVDGVLQVRIDKTAAESTISRIIDLVEQALSSKTPTARFIENFSRYYTSAVILIATLIITIPPLAMGAGWDIWLYRGLALLLIACPCALVLSTPNVIASGLMVDTRRSL